MHQCLIFTNLNCQNSVSWIYTTDLWRVQTLSVLLDSSSLASWNWRGSSSWQPSVISIQDPFSFCFRFYMPWFYHYNLPLGFSYSHWSLSSRDPCFQIFLLLVPWSWPLPTSTSRNRMPFLVFQGPRIPALLPVSAHKTDSHMSLERFPSHTKWLFSMLLCLPWDLPSPLAEFSNLNQ